MYNNRDPARIGHYEHSPDDYSHKRGEDTHTRGWDKQIMGVHIYTVPGVEPWWRSLPLESHATLARGPMAVIVIKLIINFILLF